MSNQKHFTKTYLNNIFQTLIWMFNSSLFFQIYLIIFLPCVTARGWVLPATNNFTFIPLDICLYDTLATPMYWTCDNQQLYISIHSDTACNGSQVNYLRDYWSSYDCDSENIYNDYLQFTVWDFNLLSETIQCDNFKNQQRPSSLAQIINKCMYEPGSKLYKMNTCTDQLWTTFRYVDSNCQNLIFSNNLQTECKQNETWIEITKCTTKMNAIGDNFGYIQPTKSSVLRPLDQCIQISTNYSYLYTCIDNRPSTLSWSDRTCGNVFDAVVQNSTPIAFSCSTNQYDYANLHTYSNNNCDELNLEDYHKSYPVIVNQCFNHFDDNNTMKSTIYYCEQTSLWSMEYNLPDCNSSNGSHVSENVTERCSNSTTQRYIINCQNITTTTTSLPTTTVVSTTASTTVFTPEPTPRNKRILYVREDGDTRKCWKENICGTLKQASHEANYLAGSALYNITDLEIVVHGQNPTEINRTLALYKANNISSGNPCVPQELSFMATNHESITYTFDPKYIHSMSDWYDATLCENYEDGVAQNFFEQHEYGYFSFVVNNLIIDSYTFEGRSNQPYYIAFADTFICNNCQFKDIVITANHHDNEPTLILGANVELNNCLIDNVTYIPSSHDTYDSYKYDHSFIIIDALPQSYQKQHSLFSTSMTAGTHVENIYGLSSFIHILTWGQSFTFDMLIHNVTFNKIFTMDTIIYNEPNVLETISSTINIINTNFLNINHGSIFYSMESQSVITISNVTISTPQTIEGYLTTQRSVERDNLDFYSLFVFDSDSDTVNINNVNVEYQYAHEIKSRCIDAYGESTFWTMIQWLQLERDILKIYDVQLDFYHFMYRCEYPIQLIHNNAFMTLDQLSVSNDITDSIIKEFREYITFEIDFLGVDYSNHDLYFEFSYLNYNKDDENYGDYAMIFNEKQLSVHSLNVYGYGVHETIIASVDGELTVDNAISISDTYCSNSDTAELCNFDGDVLHVNYWIRFSGIGSKCENNKMNISNSKLYFAKLLSISAGGGYIYIDNVTIAKSKSGIMTGPGVVYLEILSSEMTDVGVYYSGSQGRLFAYDRLSASFALIPYQLLIRDTKFAYISPFQFDLFDATEWFNLVAIDPYQHTTREIKLIDNIFEINDLNVLAPYPGNQTLHFLDDYSIWDTFLKNASIYTLYDRYFLYDAAMLIPNDADVHLINNKFTINPNNLYVTEKLLIENDIPLIVFNKSDNSSISNVCMSGNEFVNFAIWLQNGNLTSCVKNDIIDFIDNEDCYSYNTFGSIYENALEYNQEKPNIFNIHSNEINTTIKADLNTFIALENNIFRVYQNNTDILNIINGNYLFVNTRIEYSNISNNSLFDILIYDDNCDVNCYSYTHKQFISVLHVICSEYVGEITSYEFSVPIESIYEAKNYSLSPYFIEIFALNNGKYAPGKKVKLNYSIFDMYYQQMNSELISDPIVITYQSAANEELVPDFQLIISGYGHCPQCTDGISLSSITLDAVGNNYSFAPSVEKNQLFASNVLNITVTNCPMGYGSTTTGICDICIQGYVNLLQEEDNVCHYCNQNLLDGIQCLGEYNVIIGYDYWISVYQYSEIHEAIFEPNSSQYIVSHKCPPLMCCQSVDGCNIITDYLCAENRNVEAPLCGECISGYSELYGTNKCGECDHNYWARLLIPLCYGLLWGLFILFTKSSKEPSPHESRIEQPESSVIDKCLQCCKCFSIDDKPDEPVKMKRKEYIACLETMITKIMVYYYQGLAYILTTSGIRQTLHGFVELFNLNIFMIISPGNAEGYCLLKDMNMIQKITIPLLTTFFMIFVTILPFMFRVCKVDICCCLPRVLHLGKSAIAAILICVGQVLAVLFRLLACRNIGNLSVHYFFGARQCHDTIWMLSLTVLIIILVAFGALIVWIWCRKRNEENRSDMDLENEKHKAYYPVVSAYKEKFWWWESILFIRRTILALAFIVFDNDELKVSIAIILFIYTFIQIQIVPFKYKFENHLETLLIAMTVICIFIDIVYSSNKKTATFSNVVLSLLILLPLIFYLLFMFVHCKALFYSTDNNQNQNAQIEMVNEHESDDENDSMLALKHRTEKHMPHVDGTMSLGENDTNILMNINED